MNTNLVITPSRTRQYAPLTIRFATERDETAVTRLSALDSARVPAGLLLLAEEHGDLRAALSLNDGRAIADPFHRTAHLVELLRAAASGATAR